MRLCVPIPCFFGGMKFTDAIKKVSEIGFDAIETYDWSSLVPDDVNKACSDYGVEFISMCTTEFNMTLPEKRKDWIEGLKRSCEAANRMNVKRLITQVGQDTGAPRAEQHASIVAALEEGRKILEDSGVTIMLEPLNLLFNHQGYYLPTSLEGFDIVREVNSPNVKIVYDIYHQQISEGNIIPNVTSNLDCIAHLHSAGHPGRHELWLGESNYNYIFDKIDEAGYTGCCGLEYMPTIDPEESLREEFRRYAKK